MNYSLRQVLRGAPLVALVSLATACPADDAPADGSGSGDSTGTTGGTTMPPPTTMTATTMVDGTSSTGPGAESSTGPGADETSTGPGPGTDSSSGEPAEPEIEVSIEMNVVESGELYTIGETVDVGMMGTPVTVTINNTGTGDLTVNGVMPTAGETHYALDTGMLDATVPAGGSTSFDVTFSPLNGGFKPMSLGIDNDDADESNYVVNFEAHTTPNVYRVLTPMAAPPARFNATMVDLEDGRVMLFGGRDATGVRLGDTWVYDVEAGTWTELAPATPPPARDTYAMAHDGNGTVILYGGFDGGVVQGDTWGFDVATGEWTDLMPMMPPPALFHAEIVPLGPDSYMMFGGRDDGFAAVAQTWIYDAVANTWTDAAPAGAPSPRFAFTMGFDGFNAVTLFGGYDLSVGEPLGDTWVYDIPGNTWTQAAPVMTPGTWFAQTGGHYADGSYIVHSGKALSCCDDPDPGTWAYDPVADDWADITPASEPTPRFQAAMAFVTGANKSIIFGGNFINIGSAGANDETIEYAGPWP